MYEKQVENSMMYWSKNYMGGLSLGNAVSYCITGGFL